jgi:hypothetical protein
MRRSDPRSTSGGHRRRAAAASPSGRAALGCPTAHRKALEFGQIGFSDARLADQEGDRPRPAATTP